MLFCKTTITNQKEVTFIFSNKKSTHSKQVIGVGGVAHGVGTTFFSLALSNFLCSKMGKKTAYIELNTTNQISSLASIKGTKPFSYYGIRFFPCAMVSSLTELLNMNFDYYVLDMGVMNEYTAREFSKCHLKFLLCSHGKWKQLQSLQRITELDGIINMKRSITLLENLSNSTSFRVHTPHGIVESIPFPYLSNPFQLTPDVFKRFHQILERK